jgi:HEPN domain-containing protein
LTVAIQQKRRIAAFVEIARRELRSAELLLAEQPNAAMFFLQQSAEKLARALIEADGKLAGPTHNLRTLADILTTSHPIYDALVGVQDLSASATRYRYPSAFGRVFEVDSDPASALAEVKALHSTVLTYLSQSKMM